MFTGFVDESGHSKDKKCRFVGIAGFVAAPDVWGRFQLEWQAALDEFLGGGAFHMREFVCVPGVGLYRGWKESQRRAFFGRLIATIVDCKATPVACAVFTEDFQRLTLEHQAMTRDPYYIAFQEVTKFMTAVQVGAEDFGKIDMVYAQQDEFGATEAGRAQQLWHIVKKNFNFGSLMGTYVSAAPGDVIQLQAADLFAYEINREYESWLQRPSRPMRWGLKEILNALPNDQPMIKLYTLASLVDMLWNSGAFQTSQQNVLHFSHIAHDDINFIRARLMERARCSQGT